MHYVPEEFAALNHGCGEELEAIAKSQGGLVRELYSNQIDFDLGDEFILGEFATVRGDELVVGERSYQVVVVPPSMETWRGATLRTMEAWLAHGGKVLALAGPPGRVDGRPSNAPEAIRKQYPGGWVEVASLSRLVAAIRDMAPPFVRAADGGPLPDGLCWRRVILEDGARLYFFCNPWADPLSVEIRIEGRAVSELDTASGELRARQVRVAPDGAGVATLTLPPRGHALWLCEDGPGRGEPGPQPVERPMAVREAGSVRPDENVLVLDYCDLETPVGEWRGVPTLLADSLNWQGQGFRQNPWRGHQFRRSIIDAPIPAGARFAVTYTFECDERAAAEGAIRIAVERPWLYRITLNEQEIPADALQRWFDEHFGAAPAGGLVRPGRNRLRLEAAPFHILCEIMPVYVLGTFDVTSTECGFAISGETPLGLGDWTRAGMPFYPGAVRYGWEMDLEGEGAGLRVRVPGWRGSAAVVFLDGREAGAVFHPPYQLDLREPVAPGRHRLEIEIVGNMRNLMGPHLAEGLAGPWTWERYPEAQPAGERYHFEPCGLLAPPEVFRVDAP
jgi:hypothetical protein